MSKNDKTPRKTKEERVAEITSRSAVTTALFSLLGVVIVAVLGYFGSKSLASSSTASAITPTIENTNTPQPTIISVSETPTLLPTATAIIFPVQNGVIKADTGYIEKFLMPGAGNLLDFSLSVNFENPYPATTTDVWDFGVFFRRIDDNGYTLIVDSTGGWILRTTISGDTKTIYSDNGAKGVVLNLGENEINKLVLTVSGQTGCFSVNGYKVSDLDLSDISTKGSVSITAGYWKGNDRAGKDIRFSDFVVSTPPLVNCQ